MTKDGLNHDEHLLLLGMVHAMNFDICGVFACSRIECYECPLKAAAEAHEKFLDAVASVPKRGAE